MAERRRTILITRQADQSGEFVAEVEARGWRPVVIPMIQISEPENWGECDGALAAAGSHDAIIFTSANAVAGCCDRYETLYGASLGRAGLAVYAVGDNTKIALRKRGVETTYVPGSFSGRSLVEYFETQDIEGRKFLLPALVFCAFAQFVCYDSLLTSPALPLTVILLASFL